MINIEKWRSIFSNREYSRNYLEIDYGEDYIDFDIKRESLLDLLNLHEDKFGNENIIIIRAPGRINLMGRHIDHQGGHVNLIAIDREIFLTASPRKDSKTVAYNFNDKLFPKIEFDFSNWDLDVQDNWINIITYSELIKKVKSLGDNWENYFKAVILRIINSYGKQRLSGASFCVLGNIPIAAGLSSSSALVVGICEAILKLHKIKINHKDFVKLCAEAEWFVGTRGGASDHLAIKLCKKNKIAHAKPYELEIIEWVDFCKYIDLLICNSNIVADKSGAKRDLFNEKILAYDVGFNLLKEKFPQYSNKLELLRDVNPENLGIRAKNIIEMLLKIPEYLNFEELCEILGKNWENLKNKFVFDKTPQRLPIRKVITYGISECERSKSFINLIKSNQLELAGKMMNISHNGDRVVQFDSNFIEQPYNNELTDKILKKLIQKGSFTSQEIKLDNLTGGYGCSIPEIDFIVNLVKNHDDVLGAQLSGAGLGGCVMILVNKSYSTNLRSLITKSYKKQFHKECTVSLYKPVNGCSIYDKI